MGIHNHTIIAHFLVVKSSSEGEVENWGHCRVVLGWNNLDLLRDFVVDPQDVDASAWNATLKWYKLTRESKQLGQPVQQNVEPARAHLW